MVTVSPGLASGSAHIFWLASYPKSGNSWQRILLANYLADAEEPVDINQPGTERITSVRQVFDEHLGVESGELTLEEMERYRLAVYDKISAESDGPLFVRIHDAITRTPGGHPTMSKAATAGVLYLLRNPLDIATAMLVHAVLQATDPCAGGRPSTELASDPPTW